jgi:16S rRNA (cytosine1402-N4)-methyltransferase
MSDPAAERAGEGFSHVPVMLDEVMRALNVRPDGIYVDGTAGGAGHSAAIASRLTTGRLIAIDRDPEAVKAAAERLAVFGDRAAVVHADFTEMREVCGSLGVGAVDGVLLDLGVSSHQLDTPERGFSYMADAPLSMKMDESEPFGAYDVVNGYSRPELIRILSEWGEEKYAVRIADGICRARETAPVRTTQELCSIVRASLPDGGRSQNHHPAMRTFQAIRIEVNREIEKIPPALREAADLLRSGGRAAVITFHSVEDRAVKQTLAQLARGCTCPPDFPVCVCGKRPQIRFPSKKPILPSDEEIRRNPRAHSAKLRTAEKI